MDSLQITFLEMNGQPPTEVAGRVAAFVRQARRTIDMALYDFRLTGPQRDIVVDALHDCVDRGVKVRIAYDSDTDWSQVDPGNSKPPSPTFEAIQALGVPARPIQDVCCLMHHKYIVLDAGTSHGQVWTGSTNFTDASWSLQENNILIIASDPIARGFGRDFEELWNSGELASSGKRDIGPVRLTYKDRPAPTEVHFSPGQGKWINREIAEYLDNARERLTICAAVITSGHILGALQRLMRRGIKVDGVYDRTQMEGVYEQWEMIPDNHWKIPLFHELVDYGRLVGKITTPWSPTSVHDFMHNKILVVDDLVITGSYNFSRNAETNAENVLFINSPTVAADYRAYIGHLAERYGRET
jgi:phosphatidylserine/phosphatidylglycerophosphate/cardiolipin synthase-like enzyme